MEFFLLTSEWNDNLKNDSKNLVSRKFSPSSRKSEVVATPSTGDVVVGTEDPSPRRWALGPHTRGPRTTIMGTDHKHVGNGTRPVTRFVNSM